MDEIIKLTKSLTEMTATEIDRLHKQIEAMKCCANCGVCPHDSFEYCEDWEQDKLKRKDRERRK